MNIKQKYANLFFGILITFLTFLLLFNVFVVKLNFLKNFKYNTEILNEKIKLYNKFNINFKKLESIVKNDDREFLNLLENGYISKELDVKEFEKIFCEIVNSKSVPIEILKVDVKTNFPIIFDKDKKIMVSFQMKVGDIIE
ncbi:hypothetical protein BG95_00170 [Thermosipho sp. 1063]|uniref:hypothetical protein n=1 Tax=unclassified Thermosipho (in: thermotogales) TaxID=2676525 RepID=UPI0009494CC0|nr:MULTISPECIES: hypothetical protein [unclassified Thermosipho (in: thermotogales)]ANQ54540.1 hypothetical protein Y592_00170 [Thermosipho sp. 1070]APT72980.1 hypothetical protein BG95_00170 [Thermosipho sp. 1063]OOC46068.1 hypothetical protein XO08_00175 [Thermosipho sp. 1074]